ncbi:transmembrane protein 69-like [Penaeus monodon]|uniref:transmembrane protein 69-like n=1 Tax=Penaeus monodon TaxID=6687 RepID=UPI0018A77403|nr:transmembrane protein 69-like [Penaeus monodon]
MIPIHCLGRCPLWRPVMRLNIPELSSRPHSCKGVHVLVPRFLQTSANWRFKEDNKTTALAVLDNVKQVRYSPTPALVLGFSGLIPFVAAPLYIASSGVFMPEVAEAQLFYGASILSFLGGVRWGLTLPKESAQPPGWYNLSYSVTPSLIAVSGLLMPQTMGTLTIIGGLGFAGYMDLAMWGYPTWFKGLRFCLTFVAVLSLWSSLMFKFVLDEANTKTKEDSKVDSNVS